MARQGEKGGFGRTMHAGVRHADVGVDGRIQNDGSWVCKEGQQSLNEEIRTAYIDVEGMVECGFVPLLDGLQVGQAGINEEDIEISKLLFNSVRQFLLARNISSVRGDVDCLIA